MTNNNADKYIIDGLKRELEKQKRDYERQIEMLKMQNSELKKQLENQRKKTDERDQMNRTLTKSNSYMRGEMAHLNRQVSAYQSRVF